MQIVADSSRPVCTATRKDGQGCRATPTRDGLCLAHSPALADKRRAAYARGGRNKSRRVRLAKLVPPRLVPIFDVLEGALREVHNGRLDPPRAQAMASLAGGMVRVMTAGEVEGRFRKLEEKVDAWTSRVG